MTLVCSGAKIGTGIKEEEMDTDEKYMREAVRQAKKAYAIGGGAHRLCDRV